MNDFASIKRAEWAELVKTVAMYHGERLDAVLEEMATEAKTSKASLRNKAAAIGYAFHTRNVTEVIEQGQRPTLKAYAERNRNGAERRKRLTWLVSASLADAIKSDISSPDSEEPLMRRFYRLGLRTSEEAWEFINSWFMLEPDESLQHHMSELFPKRFKRVGVKK